MLPAKPPGLSPLLAAAALIAATNTVAAQQQRGQLPVTIVNRSSSAVQNLYITPSESLPWGVDRLGSDTLAAGGRQTLRLERTPGCRYDIRAVYSDGDHDVDTDVNLCASGTVTLTGDKDVTALRLVRLAARRPIGLFLVYNRTGVEMLELHAGSTSHLDGMTVEPGDHTVGRFRRADGCRSNLAAEFKESDPIFVEGHDLCAQPVVSVSTPERKPTVRIRNRSAYPLVSLFVRPVGFDVWGNDRFRSDTLQPRDMTRIGLGAPSCLFDIKAGFGDGEPEIRSGVNLCERKVLDVEGPEIVTGKGERKTASSASEERETLALRILNESPRTIREIFVSPARMKNWGENMLGAPLARGQSAGLSLDQHGTCLFDIMAVHEGGREQRRMNRDLCQTDTVAIGGPYPNIIDGGGPEAGLPVGFVNIGRASVRSLYLTPANDTHWGKDRLGSNQLERRSRLELRLPRAGGCEWDIRVGFGENTYEEQRRVNLCERPEQQLRKREKPGTFISTGTGFFISADGHVLTNSHVVEGCRIAAIARDGEARIPLRLLREDADADIALLKAEAAATPFIPLRGSSAAPARAGEKAVVVGYPVRSKLGVVNVTEGIVSAPGGAGRDQARMQFTAPAQPGNSGGPILDAAGQVIGVIVSRLDSIDDDRPTQNVNFGVSMAAVEAFLKKAGLSLPAASKGPEGPGKPTTVIFEAVNAAVLPLDCVE